MHSNEDPAQQQQQQKTVLRERETPLAPFFLKTSPLAASPLCDPAGWGHRGVANRSPSMAAPV